MPFPDESMIKIVPTLTAEQWKHIGKIVADAEKVANEFGLDLVFHPHVATYVETPEECELFYDATSHTNVGPVSGHRALRLRARRLRHRGREI